MVKTKILVIEDDEAVRRAVCSILRTGGYEPAEALDGRDGLDAFIHGRFSLVITDLIMPGQEGIETIERIRELDAAIPIIAISGAGDGEFSPLQDAALLGANRTVAKPFTVEHLLRAVSELLDPSEGSEGEQA